MPNTVAIYYTAILIKKTLVRSVFFRIRRKCGLCGRLTSVCFIVNNGNGICFVIRKE